MILRLRGHAHYHLYRSFVAAAKPETFRGLQDLLIVADHSRRGFARFYRRSSAFWASAFDLSIFASSLSGPPTLMRMNVSFFKTYNAPPKRLLVQKASSPIPLIFFGGIPSFSSPSPRLCSRRLSFFSLSPSCSFASPS